jgi:cytochrome c
MAVSSFKLAVVGMSALVFSAQLMAQSRPEVLERIAPVGQVTLEGQAVEAAPAAAAPAAQPAAPAAPAAEPAPVAEAAPAPAPAAAPAAAGGEGAQLFVAKTCAACHGADANTPIMPVYPRLAGQNAAYLVQQLNDIKSGARTHGQTMLMKGIMAGVSEDEIKAISEWVSKQ